MSRSLPSLKKSALIFAVILAVSLLFSWLALPRILQSQAEAYVTEKSGHHLTMQRPEFNPFELSLRLTGLQLTQPGGEPLLAFKELVVDLSSASLFRGALVFDGIRLDGLQATGVLLADGKLNWSALITALESKEKTPDSPLPRFIIHRLTLTHTQLDLSDLRVTPAFVSRITPLDIELTEFSSLLDDKGRFKFSAQTLSGIDLAWQGEASLKPLSVTGNFNISNVKIGQFSSYFKDLLPFSPPTGIAALSASYSLAFNAGKPDLHLEQISARLSEVGIQHATGPAIRAGAIEASGGRFDLAKNQLSLSSLKLSNGSLRLQRGKNDQAIALGQLAIDDINVDLTSRKANVKRVTLGDGQLEISRDAQGHIDLLEALKKLSPPSTKTEKASTQANWRYRLDKFDLTGFGIVFRNASFAPAAQFAVKDLAVGLTGISEDLNVSLPVNASFNAQDGGRFEAEGSIVPGAPTAQLQIKLTDLSIKPAQPYLNSVAKLKLASGLLSTAGGASYTAQGADYTGNFSLRDLVINEADSGNLFLSLKSLGSNAFTATPSKLDISELVVNGLDTKLIINKDKSLSFTHLLRQTDATAAPAQPVARKQIFIASIERLRFIRGEMDFADYSLALPFGTRIHDLKGIVTGLSTRPDALGQLELDGQVDEYGIARARGKIDLLNPTDLTDIKLVFRNIEMARLTPYSATFAGRKIASGKLSLDLEYKIKQRQLQGKNQVVMDQLTLGEKVDSPDAKDLPLDLAISILQDADGRIDLGLPISGSLDDPKFSYGSIVWQAITNILSKIATAPFRALGALFGGDDKFENIVFEAGNGQLAPPEREKLLRLADMLNKRPTLTLAIHGVYADTDRVALQDLQLRRTVAQSTGQHLAADEDPGPLPSHQPKTQTELESLFSDKFGGGELAALKDGFRRANPGKLEEGTAGKMMSGLKGLFREKRTLNEQEVAKLKGVDFYGVLFERLRAGIAIDDKQLQLLATTRGETTAAALREAGAPADRVSVLPYEKGNAEGPDVAVKLVLGSKAVTPGN